MAVLSETLLDILSDLNSSSRDIQASAIISSEGLVMAALIDKKLDEDRVAAMTVAISAQANRIVQEIHLGKLQQVLIKGQQGYAIIIAAGAEAVLTIMLKKSAQLGFIFLSCERSANKIAATGITKPSPRHGLVYLGKRTNKSNIKNGD